MIDIKSPILDSRLYNCASLVRKNSVICDVGTDHAYIPIFLLKNNKCKYAYATDINDGPLNSARTNAIKYGVSDKINIIKADGLKINNFESFNINDFLICGMGGELIVDIVSECNYLKSSNVRMILQPMTFVDKVRKYLYDHGFSEIETVVCSASNKLYQILEFEYSGNITEYNEAELYVGKKHLNNNLYLLLIEKYINKFSKQKNGKSIAGLNCDYETMILNQLNFIKEKI